MRRLNRKLEQPLAELSQITPDNALDASKIYATKLAEVNACSLHISMASIEVLDLALNRLQAAWASLPEGEHKQQLVRDQTRLTDALDEVRMMAFELCNQSA
jgi:hypothetical protein